MAFSRFAATSAVVALTTFTSFASAATYTFDITPGDLPLSNKIYFDVDTGSVPGIVDNTSGAPGGEGGSLITDIAGTPASRYTNLTLDLNAIFGTTVKLEDIADFTYYSKKNVGNADWGLRIYTKGADQVQWFKHRFDFLPGAGPEHQWNQWDPSTNTSVYLIAEKALNGANSFTAVSNYYLGDIRTNYGSDELLYITMLLGSTSNAGPLSTNLDNIVITLTNGDVATINFVPEPGSALLSLSGLALLARRRRA